jgi:transcriptional regulator with XRE-family HTH domain
MDIRQRLSDNMRKFRRDKGWSQEELAERAGVHRTYISGVERLVRNPTITVVGRIAGALGVKVGELVD